MKKFLLILVIGSFILSGIGIGAVQSINIMSLSEAGAYQELSVSSAPKDFTHTVFIEVGTATWCPSCPQSNGVWHVLYGSGDYDFEYTELVSDKNPVASARFDEFNPKWVPTSYWDGGEYVYPGTNIVTFCSNLDSSGSRVVPDLVADLNATWLGSAQIEISYTVENNEASNYPGHLRIYIIELESTLWDDYSGDPYHHAFLDFAENKAIDIPAAGLISDTIVWDGVIAGYPNITLDNIQIILAVFSNTPHQSYSDPPSGNPFWAYYSDECVAVIPVEKPSPPSNPDPEEGATGVDIHKTVSWTGGGSPGLTITYDVYFGTASSPPKVASNQSATNYNPGALSYSTKYYWKIVAWDQSGNSSESPVWYFTTINTPNSAPNTPTISGPTSGKPGKIYKYTIAATDPDSDMIYGYIIWGDNTTTDWVGPYVSGAEFSVTHSWAENGTYSVKVKVKDEHGTESDWTTLDVTMPYSYNIPFQLIWERLLERFPHAFPILRHLGGY
jgi:hypothetical protein